jgi:hypothetical protein
MRAGILPSRLDEEVSPDFSVWLRLDHARGYFSHCCGANSDALPSVSVFFAGGAMKWGSIALLQSFSPQETRDAEGFS